MYQPGSKYNPQKLTAKYPKMMGPWVQGGTGLKKNMAIVGIYVWILVM